MSSVLSNAFQNNESMITAGFNQNSECSSDSCQDNIDLKTVKTASKSKDKDILVPYYSNKVM